MKQQQVVEYYSRQDVLDAEWLIQTSESLNHGTIALLWAWKVINWYLGMYANVVYLIKREGMSLRAAFNKTIFLIQHNLFNPLKNLTQ